MKARNGSGARIRAQGGDESGVMGLEALAFGVLIFVVGTLLVVNAWGVVDAKVAASAAAREASRRLVEAESAQAATQDLAEQVARLTLEGHGKDGDRLDGVAVDGEFGRCERVRVTVDYTVPAIELPFIGGLGSGALDVSSTHTEIVDPFRSGLEGEAECGF